MDVAARLPDTETVDGRGAGKGRSEPTWPPIDLVDDRLGTAEEDEECAVTEDHREDVARRGTVGHRRADCPTDCQRVDRSAPVAGKRLAKPERPYGTDQCEREAEEKHGLPDAGEQEHLAEQRGDRRADEEDRHRERQDPRHLVAGVEVAGDRVADDGRTGGAEPPQEAGAEQDAERGRKRGPKRADQVERKEASSTGRRPNRSDSGPIGSCPAAMPRK